MWTSSSVSILVDGGNMGESGRGIVFVDTARLTAKDIMLMATYARGVISVALPLERACALDLAPMRGGVIRPGRPITYASVEALACTETGISAAERCTTMRALGSLQASPADFCSPGHVIVTVVPRRQDRLGQLVPLNERAFHLAAQESGALAIAWSDVLDGHGNVASAHECRRLAAQLGLRLLEQDQHDSLVEAA